MKRIIVASAALAALVAATAAASAQPGNTPDYGDGGGYAPGYAPPPPPVRRAPVRHGLTLGFDVGVGSMTAKSGPIRCDGCDGDPATGSLGFWIGAMVRPRLAILFHGSINGRSLDADGVETMWDSTALVAAKYWFTPRLWVKGGLGYASLVVTYDDGFTSTSDQLDQGGAAMLGVGLEAVHSPRFSLDVSLTGTTSSFKDIDDQIDVALLGLGLNWYSGY